jgi:hypothetical protein
MVLRALIGASIALLLTAGTALASEFDGWTVRQITRHKDFVRSDYSLSSALNGGEKDAKRVYDWIGYIPSGDKRVYFTSFGEPLTTVQWERTGEWVPEWALEALERLADEGYIELNGATEDTETIVTEGRG